MTLAGGRGPGSAQNRNTDSGLTERVARQDEGISQLERGLLGTRATRRNRRARISTGTVDSIVARAADTLEDPYENTLRRVRRAKVVTSTRPAPVHVEPSRNPWQIKKFVLNRIHLGGVARGKHLHRLHGLNGRCVPSVAQGVAETGGRSKLSITLVVKFSPCAAASVPTTKAITPDLSFKCQSSGRYPSTTLPWSRGAAEPPAPPKRKVRSHASR